MEQQPRQGIRDNVRNRGIFLCKTFIIAMACGGAFAVFGWTLFVLNQIASLGDRVRRALGLGLEAGSPDWFVLALLLVAVLAACGLMAWVYRWYRSVWMRRLEDVWPEPENRDRFAHRVSSDDRTEYLRALLRSPRWRDREGEVKAQAKGSGHALGACDLGSLTQSDCLPAIHGLAGVLRKDVSERALSLALLVTFSRNRFLDRLAIVLAGFELQLYVLTALGKKPSIGHWLTMANRSLAGLFAHTYFSHENTTEMTLTIKGGLMGVHAILATADDVLKPEELPVDEVFEAIENALSSSAGGAFLGDLVAVLKGATTFSLVGADFAISAGRVASRQLASVVERLGDDLLEGSVVGGVLYFHGCELLREALPLSRIEAENHALNPSIGDCAEDVTASAVRILWNHLCARRRQYRDVRKKCLGAVCSRAFGGPGKAVRVVLDKITSSMHEVEKSKQ